MKRIFLVPALAAATFLYSCGSQPAAETPAQASPDAAAETSSSAAQADPGLDKMEELQKLTPYSDDKMKALLPAEIGGLKRGTTELMTVLGKTASATYEQQAGTGFGVTITDCAGEQGAGKYMMAYMVPMAAQDSPAPTPETKNLTTQKKVAFAGQQALSHHDPVNDVHSLTFLKQERLFVNVTGAAGTSLADVIGFATKLNAGL